VRETAYIQTDRPRYDNYCARSVSGDLLVYMFYLFTYLFINVQRRTRPLRPGILHTASHAAQGMLGLSQKRPHIWNPDTNLSFHIAIIQRTRLVMLTAV